MGTILAIDTGEAKVGLAISDDEQRFALALKVLAAQPLDKCLAKVMEVIGQEKVEQILIGLPLNLQGQEGHQAEFAREFGDELTKLASLPLEYVDERFTTKASQFTARLKGQEDDDAESARLLLETWLERRKNQK